MIAGALVLALLVAVLTLTADDALLTRKSQPPGCVPSDKAVAGCRPVTKRGIPQGAVTAVTVAVTASVAVFVALLTARTTDRRQDAALKAEGERQEAQLRHDRELRDVEELRSVLDGFTTVLFEHAEAWATAALDLKKWGKAEADEEDAAKARVAASRTKISRITTPLWEEVSKVTLRLGTDHPVTRAATDAREACVDKNRLLSTDTKPGPELDPAMRGAVAELFAARKRLVNAAHELVGSRIGTGSRPPPPA